MTQKADILKRLRGGWSITPMQALNDFNCFRLAARIYELRSEGHDIQVETGSLKYATYWLDESSMPSIKNWIIR